ncbi:MAG: S9 family peptidase, partial [Myxococcales bacterium FL481]
NDLYDEIVGRIATDDSSVPYRYRGYYYYHRVVDGGEYPIYARRKGSLDAPEEILIDANARGATHDYYAARGLRVSPDGKLLAFAEDTIGRRQYTIRFRDLATGQDLPDAIPGNAASVAWADDNRTLFYIENDPTTLLGVRVKRHRLGTDPAQDTIVYEEPNHSYYMGLGRTGDDKFLTLSLQSTVTSEVRYLAAKHPTGTFEVLAPRSRGIEYDVDHIGERWIVRTNWDATNFRLMTVADKATGDRANWRELVAHDEAVLIEDTALFDDYLVVEERSGGLRRLRVRTWDGSREFFVSSSEEAYTTYLHVNAEQNTSWLRYGYTSMTTPTTVYEVDLASGEQRLLKRDPVLGDFDSANYGTSRVWATARDGAQIPVSLLYRRGYRPDGTAPLLQYGYGSYGASMDPSFSSTVLSLVDRGFVYAVAHVRGGSVMGRRWYNSGKLLHKRNTFTDFIDVTEHLIQSGYGAKDKIVASGGSAGGLLIGVVANLRPDLYRALVAKVPFVDVVTTMLDESIPLTTNEFDEWGNPKQREYYDYMLSYSPYDNVASQEYPAMLVTTGLWDSQVQYYEPAKWVAKLRHTKTDENPLVFHIEMGAGHGGKSGRFRRHEENAMMYAFLLDQVGLARSSTADQSRGEAER